MNTKFLIAKKRSEHCDESAYSRRVEVPVRSFDQGIPLLVGRRSSIVGDTRMLASGSAPVWLLTVQAAGRLLSCHHYKKSVDGDTMQI